MIPSQVRLLVEIENSLPKFILKRAQVYSHTEFPNQRKTLKQVVCERDSFTGHMLWPNIPRIIGDWERVNYVAVTVIWDPNSQNPSDMGIPSNPKPNR